MDGRQEVGRQAPIGRQTGLVLADQLTERQSADVVPDDSGEGVDVGPESTRRSI
jgi:hypothetical protein